MTHHLHRRVDDPEALPVSPPPPITEEQLDFFTEATERTTVKAANAAVRKYLRFALVGYLLLFSGIVAERIVSGQEAADSRQAIVQSGTVVAVDACNQRFKDRTEVRAVLEGSKAFQARSLKNGTITRQQYDAAVGFYDERLKGLPLPDCRLTLGVLTTDPDDAPAIPEPLYPGAPDTKAKGKTDPSAPTEGTKKKG